MLGLAVTLWGGAERDRQRHGYWNVTATASVKLEVVCPPVASLGGGGRV